MKELLDHDAETRPAEERARHWQALWPAQWDYVRSRSAFYQHKLADHLNQDLSLQELEALPFTDKEELRESQHSRWPMGEYLACEERDVIRLHRTSGTTGRALHIALTREDAEWIARIGGRAFFCAGLRPHDRVVHCLSFCMWAGGLTDDLSLERAGALVVPYGVGNSRGLIDLIPDLGITAISCTPSYPRLLERIMQETGDPRRPADLGLRLALFGGEAGLDNPEFRRRLEDTWGFRVRNANYGLSEVVSILASQCEHVQDLHFHADEAVFPEIVDSATGVRLPLREGETGELVCTHLRRRAQPLVRYRTRDVITVTGMDACACGRTAWRFRVTGRTDEMFNVRGVNVFPTAVQKVLVGHPELCTGEFRIDLHGPGPYDRIVARVEAAQGLPEMQWVSAAGELAASIRREIGASADIRIIPAGSLPRTEGKTNLVERHES